MSFRFSPISDVVQDLIIINNDFLYNNTPVVPGATPLPVCECFSLVSWTTQLILKVVTRTA